MAQDVDTGKGAVLDSLTAAPLGSVEGDINPNIARNAKAMTAVYFARNLSGTLKRRTIDIAVTVGVGYDNPKVKKYWGNMDGEEIRKQCAQGRDMNLYKNDVYPVRKVLKFNNQLIEVPVDGTEISIPEGLWDIYLGNYDRIRSKDNLTQSQEYERLSNRWCSPGTPNPVYEAGTEPPKDHDGRQTAFIEFRRQEIHVQQATQDLTKVYASEGVEV